MSTGLNRRKFLATLGIATPATVLAARLGITVKQGHSFDNNGASSGVCQICGDAITVHRSVKIGEATWPIIP